MLRFMHPGSKSAVIPSSPLNIYQFTQRPHWDPRTELNDGHLSHSPCSAAGSVPRTQSPLTVANCCCLLHQPQRHPRSVSKMSAPCSVEPSPHRLAFPSETFLCSHSIRAVGDGFSQLVHGRACVCSCRTRCRSLAMLGLAHQNALTETNWHQLLPAPSWHHLWDGGTGSHLLAAAPVHPSLSGLKLTPSVRAVTSTASRGPEEASAGARSLPAAPGTAVTCCIGRKL